MKRGNLWPLCTAGGPLALAPPLSAYTQRDRRRLQVFTANALFMPPSRAVERTRDGGREAERSGERNFITHRIFWWRIVSTTAAAAAAQHGFAPTNGTADSETWSGERGGRARSPVERYLQRRSRSRHEVILMRTNLIFLSFPYSSLSLSLPPSLPLQRTFASRSFFSCCHRRAAADHMSRIICSMSVDSP